MKETLFHSAQAVGLPCQKNKYNFRMKTIICHALRFVFSSTRMSASILLVVMGSTRASRSPPRMYKVMLFALHLPPKKCEKRINDVSLECSTLPIKLSPRFGGRKLKLMFVLGWKVAKDFCAKEFRCWTVGDGDSTFLDVNLFGEIYGLCSQNGGTRKKHELGRCTRLILHKLLTWFSQRNDQV